MKFEILSYHEVTSTMDTARNLLNEASRGDFVVVAETQTIGRGRNSRTWLSPRGGLYATFALSCSKPPQELLGISLVVGLSLHRALIELGIKTRLKWPNDVLVENKKIAGTLIETMLCGKNSALLIGIGLNVGAIDFPSNIPGISLEQITKKEYKIPDILPILSSHLSRAIDTFFTVGFIVLKDEWLAASQMHGVAVEYNGIQATCETITNNGALILKNMRNNELVEVISGDVNLIA